MEAQTPSEMNPITTSATVAASGPRNQHQVQSCTHPSDLRRHPTPGMRDASGVSAQQSSSRRSGERTAIARQMPLVRRPDARTKVGVHPGRPGAGGPCRSVNPGRHIESDYLKATPGNPSWHAGQRQISALNPYTPYSCPHTRHRITNTRCPTGPVCGVLRTTSCPSRFV